MSAKPSPEETKPAWNLGWDITEEEREVFRQRSKGSAKAKAAAQRGDGPAPVHEVNIPRLIPDQLMQQCDENGIRSLSLFSGCGGLDLGFDRAGYEHVASYDYYAPAA